jgi:hypothetical protein
MNNEQLELIKTIAGQVMGWQILDKPLDRDEQPAEGAGTSFLIHKGKPMSAQPFEISKSYVYIWEDWNPLTTANAWHQILEKLIDQAAFVEIRASLTGYYVTINDSEPTVRTIRNANDIGLAICHAALEFMRLLRNDWTDTNATLAILRDHMNQHGWPDEVNWVAVDDSGDILGYREKPAPGPGFWKNTDGPYWRIDSLRLKAGPNWQELIIEKGEQPVD